MKNLLEELNFFKGIKEAFIVMITDNKGSIVYVNQLFKDIYGYTEEDVIGKQPDIMKHPSNNIQDDFNTIYKKIINKELAHGDFANNHKDGSVIWESKTIIPYNNYFVSIGRDITIQKEILLKEEEIKQQENLVLAGEMTSEILHEIANKLSVNQGYILKLKKGYLNNDDVLLEQSIDSLQRINNEILDIFKSMRGLTSSSSLDDVQEVIQNVIVLLSGEFKRHKITVKLNNNCESFSIDKVKFSQIVHNLIKNSIEAIKSNSNNKWITININKNKNNLDISFIDSGDGIPSVIQNKIFNNRFTTKEEGTGIGLYFIKRLIEKTWNGNLFINKDNVKNTEFILSIPIKNLNN